MVVLEILTFTGSEQYISTRGASFDAYTFLPAEGLHRIFRGTEHENEQRGYIFAGWDSVEHHEQAFKSPEYDSLKADFAKSMVEGPEKIIHVSFGDKDINYNIFSLPVLEILTVKADSTDSRAAIRQILDGYQSRVLRPELSAWGEVIEEAGTFKFFVGWNSVQEHMEYAKKLGAHEEVEKTFSGLATRELVHATNLSEVKISPRL